MSDLAPQTVVLVGRSGCGKGTQSAELLKYLGERSPEVPVIYIQTGKLLRELISTGRGETVDRARRLMETGGRFPDFLAVWNWSQPLVANFTGHEHIVIDGAPRSLLEAQMLGTAFAFYGRQPATIFHLAVSHDWAVERLRGRGRADDLSAADIEARLTWFESEVQPAIDFFRSRPEYRFVEVNGEQPIEAVHQEIIAKL